MNNRTELTAPGSQSLRVAIIAGEASGDHLGGPLMREISSRVNGNVSFLGVGGKEMGKAGLTSLFPMSEIALMGIWAILRRLPNLIRRVLQTAKAICDWQPDVLVIIDCPEFSHQVARRVRARNPEIPIIDYVAPTVWAWRSGRAKSMLRYVDKVMAVLPFEPEVFKRLGGPECHYVGHAAGERPSADKNLVADIKSRASADGPVLAVLPGSRVNEIKRLIGPFGEAVALLANTAPTLGIVMPILPHTKVLIEPMIKDWPVKPVIVTSDAERYAAMEAADAAIVASGTATLELALAMTPMVVGYRTERLSAWARHHLPIQSIVLANLIHGENAIEELFQERCTGERLAKSVQPLLSETDERRHMLVALQDICDKLRTPDKTPSSAAADIVLAAVAKK